MTVELAKLLVLTLLVVYLLMGPVRAKMHDLAHHKRAQQNVADISRMQSTFPKSDPPRRA